MKASSLWIACLALCGCAPDPEQPLLEPLEDLGGITFQHVAGGVGNRELPETMGGGVALLDFEGDGDLDVYAVQSGPMRTPTADESRAGAENELWRNQGVSSAQFERVAEAGGAADAGYGQGVAVGDANGDGSDDLFVLNWGPNSIYLQTGGGFGRTDQSSLEADTWSVSGAFFDADLDLSLIHI